ncbi:MAG: hypothetical protein RRA94_14190 [Bacteroidota bacterium]|nr:hypothetical protein [Bacteroidota bacterium]
MKRRFVYLSFIIPAFLLLATSSLHAQSGEREYFMKKAHWGVGAQAGLMSGMGVGVRFHPQGRFGVQLAGGAIAGEKTVASVGFEGQFDLDWRNRSRFFVFAGMGYYTNGEDELTVADGTWEEGKEDPRLVSPFRAGLGLGYEWDISNTLIFTANIAFTYFSEGTFLPLPQVGLYYMFD